jgi:hypothetical protein
MGPWFKKITFFEDRDFEYTFYVPSAYIWGEILFVEYYVVEYYIVETIFLSFWFVYPGCEIDFAFKDGRKF